MLVKHKELIPGRMELSALEVLTVLTSGVEASSAVCTETSEFFVHSKPFPLNSEKSLSSPNMFIFLDKGDKYI